MRPMPEFRRPPPDPLEKATAERILSVRRWSEKLFSVRVSRSPAFRFTPGQWVRLGMPSGSGLPGSVIWRPYSMVSAAEAIGQSLDIIIPERLREAHWRGFNAAIASGRTRLNGRPTVTRALHKSGATLYVEMSFAMVCAATGEVIGSVAVARDATERVQREKAARNTGQA